MSEAYMLACTGHPIDQEDMYILRYSIEGYDCVNNKGFKNALVKLDFRYRGDSNEKDETS